MEHDKENTLFVGLKMEMEFWEMFLRSIKYKPVNVGFLYSVNPFASPIFYDMLRKILFHLKLPFNAKQKKSAEGEKLISIYLDGAKLFFKWGQRAEALWVINEVYNNKNYEEVNSGIVVDVGAHIGVYSRYASSRAKLVIAVEPDRNNFDMLSKNKTGNMVLLNCALSDRCGEAKLFTSDLTMGSSLKRDDSAHISETVNCETLDNILEPFTKEFNGIDLVKIDAEGSEMEILRGAENLLKNRTIKKLVLASYHYPEERFQVEEYLRSFGYKTHVNRRTEIIVFGEI